MAGMLLLNPRRRRKARAANPRRKHAKRRASPLYARKRARSANPRRRRRNSIAFPVGASFMAANPRRRRAKSRRRNPIHLMRRHTRRRRNPLHMGGIVGMLKDAALMGAGALAVDVAWGNINALLPKALQMNTATTGDTTNPGSVGVGDALKIAATVMVGQLLDGPTRGMARKAAMGSLVVQFRDILSSYVPSSLPMAGMGYVQPAPTINGQMWTGPHKRRAGAGMGYLTRPGAATPLLRGVGFLTRPGASTPLLRGVQRSYATGVVASANPGIRL